MLVGHVRNRIVGGMGSSEFESTAGRMKTVFSASNCGNIRACCSLEVIGIVPSFGIVPDLPLTSATHTHTHTHTYLCVSTQACYLGQRLCC